MPNLTIGSIALNLKDFFACRSLRVVPPVGIILQKGFITRGDFLHPVRNDARCFAARLGPRIIPAGLNALLEFLTGFAHPANRCLALERR
jgi:hypothetical protein